MPYLRLAVVAALAAVLAVTAAPYGPHPGATADPESPAASDATLRIPLVGRVELAATRPAPPTSATSTSTKVQGGKVKPTPTPTGTPTPSPTPTPTAPSTTWAVPVGVTVPWGPLDAQRLAGTTAMLRHVPAYLEWYTGFGEAPDVAKLQAVADAGSVPVVTWEPWVWTGGVDQPAYALDRVTAGDFDAYLVQWADALAAWDRPVLLRFAHEMNGSWYPWSAGVNGNTAADYVDAWRHVHDVFAAHGADEVRWVWAPNVVHPGSTSLTALYPGDAYVDVLGVDGYNWGTSVSWGSWVSGRQVFEQTFTELRALAPAKPLLVTETASSEAGGSKAAWVEDLVAWSAGQALLGVIWFDEDKETDWRMASSPESAAAFAAALYR
ncbi:glycoside hydrolase family 26 protein [Cellulomonas sp. NPDC055163]